MAKTNLSVFSVGTVGWGDADIVSWGDGVQGKPKTIKRPYNRLKTPCSANQLAFGNLLEFSGLLGEIVANTLHYKSIEEESTVMCPIKQKSSHCGYRYINQNVLDNYEVCLDNFLDNQYRKLQKFLVFSKSQQRLLLYFKCATLVL